MIRLQEAMAACLHIVFESARVIAVLISVLIWSSCEDELIEHNEGDLAVLQDIIDLNDLQSREPMLVDLNGNDEMDGSEPFDDLNGNGIWDLAEPFDDLNDNGIRDEGESFFDFDGDGVYDVGEPFSDDNNNGVYDDVEPFDDLNGNGIWDLGEDYDDWGLDGVNSTDDYGEGNGIWDQEIYIDYDADGIRNSPLVIEPLGLGIQHWRNGRLVYLWLSNPRVSKLPGSIDVLAELEELHVINTYLDSLPSEIGNLFKLSELRLEYTRLAQLPESIGNLTGLQVLRVQHSFLDQVPSFINELVGLKELWLKGNTITGIDNLNCALAEQLDVLSIQENSICPMPESLSDTNGNRTWDASEEFTDENENGVWDPAEEFSDFGLDGIADTGDAGEGNSVWDFWDHPECLAGSITDQECTQ